MNKGAYKIAIFMQKRQRKRALICILYFINLNLHKFCNTATQTDNFLQIQEETTTTKCQQKQYDFIQADI